MRWLATLAPPGAIPVLVFEEQAYDLLAMQAVPQPHANWKSMLLEGLIDPDHVRQFGQLLGCIHRRARLASRRLESVSGDSRFFETLRLEPFYAHPAEHLSAAAPFLTGLIRETRAVRESLVHGDYSPKNILIHRGRLVLLDHEVIHWGDPMFDVGFALAHLCNGAGCFMGTGACRWRIGPWRRHRGTGRNLGLIFRAESGLSPRSKFATTVSRPAGPIVRGAAQTKSTAMATTPGLRAQAARNSSPCCASCAGRAV